MTVTDTNTSAGIHRKANRVVGTRGWLVVMILLWAIRLPAANLPPIVTLDHTWNDTVSIGSLVIIPGKAEDPDGLITKIELWVGGLKQEERVFGSQTVFIDFLAIRDLPPGDHTFFVVAEDNSGARTSSATNEVHVYSSAEIRLTAPYPGQAFVLGDPIVLSADVAMDYGNPSEVAFVRDFGMGFWQELGRVSVPPYSLVWTPGEPGLFSVFARAWVGLDTPTVSIVVNPPGLPLILKQPQSVGFTIGGTYSLSVSALSRTPLEYQWLHGGLPLAGATNSSLTLTNAQSSDAGLYYVLIRNHAGVMRSDAAVLSNPSQTNGSGGTIYFANRISEIGVDAPILESCGGTNRLTSTQYTVELVVGTAPDRLNRVAYQNTVVGGYIPPRLVTLQFMAPGQSAYAAIRLQGINNPWLVSVSPILKVTLGDSTHPAYLTGLEPFVPEHVDNCHLNIIPTASPIDRRVLVGGSTTFSTSAATQAGGCCPAFPVQYQWRKDGIDIPGATNSFFTLTNIQQHDIAIYSILETDGYRAWEAPGFRLSILFGPTIVPLSTGTAGTVAFELLGEPPQRYQVLISTTLNDWFEIATVTNLTGAVRFTDATSNTAAPRFYRAAVRSE